MKTSAIFRALAVAVAAAALTAPGSAHACAVCMGGADSQTGPALNGAIFLLLGCIGSMMLGIGGVAFSIYRRSQSPLATQFDDIDDLDA